MIKITLLLLLIVSTNVFAYGAAYCDYNDCDSGGSVGIFGYIAIFIVFGLVLWGLIAEFICSRKKDVSSVVCEWTMVSQNNNFLTFVALSTIRKKGNKILVLRLDDYKKIQQTSNNDATKIFNYQSVITRNEFDCKRKTVRFVGDTTWYSGKMADYLDGALHDFTTSEPVSIATDSIEESILQIVRSYKIPDDPHYPYPTSRRFNAAKVQDPLLITEEEKARVKKHYDDKQEARLKKKHERAMSKLPAVLFLQGEVIRVNDGPFKDFNGVVEEVNYETKKLKISVLIFGRSTSVELSFWQVEKS